MIIEFFSPCCTSCLFHCPIQGPQAFASTSPPTFVKESRCPSLSIVALICYEPGVITNSDFTFNPLSIAWLATDAARSISSYEEFVQLPIKATFNFSG